jgi:hypothetical protein
MRLQIYYSILGLEPSKAIDITLDENNVPISSFMFQMRYRKLWQLEQIMTVKKLISDKVWKRFQCFSKDLMGSHLIWEKKISN